MCILMFSFHSSESKIAQTLNISVVTAAIEVVGVNDVWQCCRLNFVSFNISILFNLCVSVCPGPSESLEYLEHSPHRGAEVHGVPRGRHRPDVDVPQRRGDVRLHPAVRPQRERRVSAG